jgi:hypothetical protein
MKIKELHSECFLSDRYQYYDNCCASYPVTCTTSKNHMISDLVNMEATLT